MDITDAELAALANYQHSPPFSTLDKLVLELAVAMCRTPAEVPDRLRDALLEHLTPAQFTEVAATIAWENHRARINRALGVRAAGFADGASCVVPHHPQD
jgi:alkylhydroperoxidase family enzyme